MGCPAPLRVQGHLPFRARAGGCGFFIYRGISGDIHVCISTCRGVNGDICGPIGKYGKRGNEVGA